jgi:uncharacterized protein (TIGR00251 family)
LVTEVNPLTKIFVKVKASARSESIRKIDENRYAVSVKEPPIGGRANAAVTKLLADYFSKGVSQVRIISGRTAKNKIIEIL